MFRFEVTNLYKQDMNMMDVRSSCGCTSPTIENPIIKTHEKAYMVARFNTRTPPHMGQNGATLTVSFGAPYYAEVQLHVHGNIRSDVVFNPGAVEFGEINEGEPAAEANRRRIRRPRRTGKSSTSRTRTTISKSSLIETARSAGRVSYTLGVKLKAGLPAGYIKDQLTVVTNDARPENQRIPLFVSGHIRPEFSVTPELLVLGELEPGSRDHQEDRRPRPRAV